MDPFVDKPQSEGGSIYFNLGNISEDILKDGRKSLENGMPTNGDYSETETTVWGRVPKKQPIVNVFDNDPVKRKLQDIGLDGLNDEDERIHFSEFLNRLPQQAQQKVMQDPSSDNFEYYLGQKWDAENAGILKRYQNYNGTENNSRTAQQAQQELGLENAASTLLPDGEDINRDNNMNQVEEYFQYHLRLKPSEMQIGKNYIVDKHDSKVKLANGKNTEVTWYQFRIPITQYQERIGDIRDFKSIRFIRMFLTDFADTAVIRLAKLELVSGEWRSYNAENAMAKVIADPELGNAAPDLSQVEIATVGIEKNGKRQPIPYVVPPGIYRQVDYSNTYNVVQLNEQALSFTVKNLRDGYGRGTFRNSALDLRTHRNLEMFIHAEGEGLRNGDLHAFIRLGMDGTDNYYEYEIPLQVTPYGTLDPELIWPVANRMDLEIERLQKAKEERNRALWNDQPWPIEKPFVLSDSKGVITIKGQPELSKVRFYMLGVKNPLRNPSSPLNDDGLDKSGIVWFNELRLTGFENKGGWAATMRLNAQLADLGDLAISASKSTVGFGSLEQRIGERSREDEKFMNVSTSIELGKFFPEHIGMRIPMYFNYSSQIRTPEYNPLVPDLLLKTSLSDLNRMERDSVLRLTQDVTTRRSINFTNVRKLRMNPERPNRIWDVENLSASFAFSEYLHRDYLTQRNSQKNYRASLAYDFNSSHERYLEPFKKTIKNKSWSLLRDMNFNLMPSILNFRIEVDRLYGENTLRENSPNNYLPVGTLYNKNFNMTRVYGISWNLTKSLKMDFNATNYSIIEEPEGRMTSLKRDTLWSNFWRLGKTMDYNHMLNLNYTLPLHKLPGMDWLNVVTRYGSQFNWQAEPLFMQQDPNVNLGNSIQNSRVIQINPTLNLVSLYRKLGYSRGNGRGAWLGELLTSIKTVNAAFTRSQGTFLPGYLPETSLFGNDFKWGAPGLGFVFGSQRDIRWRAANEGWITKDTTQNLQYAQNLKEDLAIRALIEPFEDLQIEITGERIKSQSYSSTFRYFEEEQAFQNMSPATNGAYSISFTSFKTAFKNPDKLYQQFEASKAAISRQLGSKNPNSKGVSGGFADGYGPESQDVVVAAFITTYSGKKAGKQKGSSFPSFPLPNWRISYKGLGKLALFEEVFSSVNLSHGYRSHYSVNNYQSLSRNALVNGFPATRDRNDNFLPEFQFSQISIQEEFLPLLGIDVRFMNNVSLNAEYRKSRVLNLSLQNSQLALLDDKAMVFGMGYRVTGFRIPFGLFGGVKLENDLSFKLDVALNDLKTSVFRTGNESSEIASGNKSITFRPSIDYLINQRFSIRMFLDSNAVKPYTSQTYATSYSNFGLNLRVFLQ